MVKTASHARVARRPVHGVLLLDKPLGLSSNQALQKAKWLLRAVKGGHTGTLDPLATGVLPLCFGAATKFAQVQLDADKSYRATVRLGISTSTGDSEGEVIRQSDAHVTLEQLLSVLPQFQGKIRQIPPMHSALKHEGKALYEYARSGVEIERQPREVTIYGLDVTMLDPQTFEMDVRCSKGTYIRTLASDIGDALRCGAHLLALRRTATGGFLQNECITLDELAAMDEQARLAQLKTADTLLGDAPEVFLDSADAGRFLTGMRRNTDMADAPMVKVMGRHPDAFLGMAHVRSGELIPQRLLSPIEIQQSIEQTQVLTGEN